jgi:mercuric ion transport protein
MSSELQRMDLPLVTRKRSPVLSYLSLFGSLSTLLCCALPSLLVLLGLGATVASVLASAPWLVALSRHKGWVFSIAGALIGLSFVQMYAIAPRLRDDEACAADDPSACDTTTRVGRVVLWISAAIYLIGCFVAFALGPILTRWDR